MNENGRGWIAEVVAHCAPYEIEQCMGDLLDRAEFAEEIARREILERLVGTLERTPLRNISAETSAILGELADLRRTGHVAS